MDCVNGEMTDPVSTGNFKLIKIVKLFSLVKYPEYEADY